MMTDREYSKEHVAAYWAVVRTEARLRELSMRQGCKTPEARRESINKARQILGVMRDDD